MKSQLEKSIPALYRRTALSQLMFGFVTGCRNTLHTITIHDAILMFMDVYGLSPDEYNVDSAKVIYNRMSKELKQLNHT